MPHVLAENAKLYRNTGTYQSPNWNLIPNVKDLTLNLEKDETDVTTRASGGFKEFVDGLIDATIEFNMLWDSSDADFTAIQGAFFAKTAVEFLVLDGAVVQEQNGPAVTGNQGLRAVCMIKSFSRSETLGEALMVDVTVRPVKNAAPPAGGPPSWYVVS